MARDIAVLADVVRDVPSARLHLTHVSTRGALEAVRAAAPAATVAAVQLRIGELGGISTMMPSTDAAWVGSELARRFGLPLWSFPLTATDANRWAIRLCFDGNRLNLGGMSGGLPPCKSPPNCPN